MQPFANICATQTRISRPGLRVFCSGDLPFGRDSFRDIWVRSLSPPPPTRTLVHGNHCESPFVMRPLIRSSLFNEESENDFTLLEDSGEYFVSFGNRTGTYLEFVPDAFQRRGNLAGAVSGGHARQLFHSDEGGFRTMERTRMKTPNRPAGRLSLPSRTLIVSPSVTDTTLPANSASKAVALYEREGNCFLLPNQELYHHFDDDGR